VLLLVGEKLQVELRVAERDLGLQLFDRGDPAVLAQVYRLPIAHRLAVMAGLALLLLHELAALGGIRSGRERGKRQEEWKKNDAHCRADHTATSGPRPTPT
jgi:hypothetical protein